MDRAERLLIDVAGRRVSQATSGQRPTEGHSSFKSRGLSYSIAEKGLHVVLFTVLAVLLWKAMADATKKILSVILFGTLVGSASEFLQAFFPNRDPALRDIMINIGG